MMCPSFEQTWIFFTQEILVPSLVELNQPSCTCSGEEDFLKYCHYFCYFVIISPWKTPGPSFKNLHLIHPRMLHTKFGWIWVSGSVVNFLLNFFNVFAPFHYYLPLEKGRALHTWILSAKFGCYWLRWARKCSIQNPFLRK